MRGIECTCVCKALHGRRWKVGFLVDFFKIAWVCMGCHMGSGCFCFFGHIGI